jgi:hypothetical protein
MRLFFIAPASVNIATKSLFERTRTSKSSGRFWCRPASTRTVSG